MPTPHDDSPLIVTAHLGPESFAVLDGLRRRHFPASLNKVPAHISLFHQLPGQSVDAVVEAATSSCRGYRGFDLEPSGVRSLGRGVAITYAGGPLLPLHDALASMWARWLTPQDRQPFKPHVTIQNKVAPDDARVLYQAMRLQSLPVCSVEGLAVWRYLGGPWAAVATCLFGAGQ